MAVVWVSLGLQPCAVAAVADTDCPHQAREEAAPMAHHDHGAAQDDSLCDVAESPCCEAGAVTLVDGRSNPAKGDDGGDFEEPPPTFDIRLPGEPDRPPDKAVEAAAAPPPTRPLHVLHCVYLD